MTAKTARDLLLTQRLNFALVIEEADSLRSSIVALLRERGWLVHGINRAEQAFVILAHIPYTLIVLDSELPGINGMDFVRIMQNSRDWHKIDLIVISNSRHASLASEIAGSDAFLARRSMWRDRIDKANTNHERRIKKNEGRSAPKTCA